VLREIAEHRLLREAQAVAEQAGEQSGLEYFVWPPNNLVPSRPRVCKSSSTGTTSR
jgi:hypothetical protein